MSYSYGKQGTRDEVKKYLDEEAPKALDHVVGVERMIADRILGAARAAVEATDGSKFNINLSAYGSAYFVVDNQTSQAVGLKIDLLYKPAAEEGEGTAKV